MTGQTTGGEADAVVTATFAGDCGVDADDFAGKVDECAAAVAGIDGGIGLDEVLIALDAQVLAANRADDAGGDGLGKPERRADGDDPFADLELRGVSEAGAGKVGGADVDDGEVGECVLADEGSLKLAIVREGDGDLLGALDHVGIGDDVAVGTDDDA